MCNSCPSTMGFNPFMSQWGASSNSYAQSTPGYGCPNLLFGQPQQGAQDPFMMMAMMMMMQSADTKCEQGETQTKTMTPADAVKIIKANFDDVQSAKNGKKDTDGLLGKGDLDAVIKNKDGKFSDELVQAAKVLKDCPTLFDELDSVSSKDGETDGLISENDIEKHKEDKAYVYKESEYEVETDCSHNEHSDETQMNPFMQFFMQFFMQLFGGGW